MTYDRSTASTFVTMDGDLRNLMFRPTFVVWMFTMEEDSISP
jgi:hypothetical protein